LLFGVRQKLVTDSGNIAFNLLQVGLAVLTIVALAVLFYAIQQGLLGRPDMQIAGNGSTAYVLNWYQDQVQETLPRIWVLSVPLTVYRVLMLLWALWLAYSVLGWLRWAWHQYGIDGYWRKSEQGTPANAAEAQQSVSGNEAVSKSHEAGEEGKPDIKKPDPWVE
jgi:hypothetical protein